MDKKILSLDNHSTCTAWNYSGHRLAAGSGNGSVTIYDSDDSASSNFTRTSTFKAQEVGIRKVVWVPPEFGDAVACIGSDGSLLLWEEVVEDGDLLEWKLRHSFKNNSSMVLDVQFGVFSSSLKMVAAYSDGVVKICELLDPLDLENWQLQAEFQNLIESTSKVGQVSCLSATISWIPQRVASQRSSFILGFNSDTAQMNSAKVWEFDEDHQRWLPVAELALSENKGDQVLSVAWAPNIGRPYEVIAVATLKGISIWHVGSNPDTDGRLSSKMAAFLSGHNGEVWEMEWDMSGMTLATTGADNVVKLWQMNLNGEWREEAVYQSTP